MALALQYQPNSQYAISHIPYSHQGSLLEKYYRRQARQAHYRLQVLSMLEHPRQDLPVLEYPRQYPPMLE